MLTAPVVDSLRRTVVRVSPKDRLELARRGVAFEVLNTDLQASLDREQARLAERPARFDNETVRQPLAPAVQRQAPNP